MILICEICLLLYYRNCPTTSGTLGTCHKCGDTDMDCSQFKDESVLLKNEDIDEKATLEEL